MKSIRSLTIIGLLFFILISGLASPLVPHTSGSLLVKTTQAPLPGNGLDYLLVIVMENHGLNSIIGSSSAPYMNQLANNYTLLTHYGYVGSPSLPNYLALLAGSTFGCSSDPLPNSNTCTSNAWNSMNLVDSLETAGYSWKAYMEDMPSNCYASDSGRYYAHHDPFVYFSDIYSNPTRCSMVVPAGTSDSSLLSDLQSTTTSSNFMWLTPNGCNDMHDCPVSTGDNYLSGLIPQILDSNVFRTQKAAIFLVFDESSSSDSYVYAVWAGSAVKQSYKSSNSYDHYSLIKTIEATWAITGPATQEVSGAGAMTEVLPSYVASPPSPSLVSTTVLLEIVAVIIGGVLISVIAIMRSRRRSVNPVHPNINSAKPI